LKGRSFAGEEELLFVLPDLLSGMPPAMILRVLLTGIEGCGFIF
jgi:hypothetical protein